jgi:hypothetical protein
MLTSDGLLFPSRKPMKNKNSPKPPRPSYGRREIETGSSRPVCLHCGNAFNAGDGVVTADAAVCDICNDSD